MSRTDVEALLSSISLPESHLDCKSSQSEETDLQGCAEVHIVLTVFSPFKNLLECVTRAENTANPSEL